MSEEITTPEDNLTDESKGLDFIPSEYQEASWATKYTTPEDFFKGVDSMSKMVGQKTQGIQPLNEDSTEEDREAFYTAMGRPENAESYDLSHSVENPLIDVDTAMQDLSSMAFKHGLSQSQAQGIFADYIELMNGKVSEQAIDPQNTAKDLWKDESDKNVKIAIHGAKHLGDDFGEQLDKAGLSGHPLVLQMAHALGQLTSEDTIIEPSASTPQSFDEMKAEAMKIQRSPEYINGDKKAHDEVQELYRKMYPEQ